jgi:hypothetical protein
MLYPDFMFRFTELKGGKILMTELKDAIKEQNKVASGWLIYYRQRKKEHEEKKQEIYSRPEKPLRSSSKLGNPTEVLAVNIIEHDCFSNTAKWLETVEHVERMIGHKKSLLLRLRQENSFCTAPSHGGRPGWIARVHVRFGEIEGWCPAEQVLRNMWNETINLAIRLAFMKKCKF